MGLHNRQCKVQCGRVQIWGKQLHTTNLFRKSLVTEGDLEDRSQRENNSTLLENSVVTAQKHYRLITKPTGVVNAATFADKLMFGEKGAAILDSELGK